MLNNFASLKRFKNDICFLSSKNFKEISFEKKLSTGISTPNLDVYFETGDEIIGVESKYIEYLTSKLPNHNGNLSTYLNNSKLDYLSEDFHSKLINFYVKYKKKINLDVAQLIKHTIALIYNAKKVGENRKIPVLVYIYWQPENWFDIEIFRAHNRDIMEFSNLIKPFIKFIPISYLDFWKNYESDKCFGYIIRKVKQRYNLIL